MSEFRQNPLNHSLILMSPNRSKRPDEFKTYSVMNGVPESDPSCVFCPGLEAKNRELARYPKTGDWQIRLIENKFHILDKDIENLSKKEFFTSYEGYGLHEVLITRKHNEPVALQSIMGISVSLQALAERMRLAYEDEKISYVQIFHNHGRDAGASLVHPHYQLLATPIVPPHFHREILGAYNYLQDHGECFYCALILEERKLGNRLVKETNKFIVICAYASRKPFETWIFPKTHAARFEEITAADAEELASILKWILGRLYIKLSDPPLNFYVHTMPAARAKHIAHETNAMHWHLTVFPRITIWGGFEYAAGIPVNPVLPEIAAEFLRD